MSVAYDAVVLGAGHAGCEAALALARMGLSTLVITLNLDSVALMACNPAIGGTSKGHLVREIDALGGEMGLAADAEFIQMRMLNTGKGPAVHSLRAQMDKRRYHERMKRALEAQENLDILQGEVSEILTENGHVSAVRLSGGVNTEGERIACRPSSSPRGYTSKAASSSGDHGARKRPLPAAARRGAFRPRSHRSGLHYAALKPERPRACSEERLIMPKWRFSRAMYPRRISPS